MFSKSIRIVLFLTLALCLSLAEAQTHAKAQASAQPSASTLTTTTVYSQPPSGALLQHQSSQLGYDPYASDYDQYVWDNFTLNSTRAITEITWRGVYLSGGFSGGGVIDFTVAIYGSTAGNTQPDHLNPPLVNYTIGGKAGETPAWTAGGASMSLHDYSFTLPTPFTATAGTKYWVQIEGIQNGPTDWGVVAGSGGDNSHFFAIPGASDFRFGAAPGDAAFTLLGPPTGPSETPLTAVAISGPATGTVNTAYTFTATVSPPTATTPISYTWAPVPDSGQGTKVATYSWPSAGSKTITVTATNVDGTASDTHKVQIHSPLLGVVINGPATGTVNMAYTFTATVSPITATTPISYTWAPLPASGQGTAVATYSWPSAGSKTITVTATNVDGTASDTHKVQIHSPLLGVVINGPVTGTVNMAYTFTATVSPPTATTPISYTWAPAPDSGQGTKVATYSWPSAGSKTITVTATNVDGSMSDTHPIALVKQNRIHLPLIQRGGSPGAQP